MNRVERITEAGTPERDEFTRKARVLARTLYVDDETNAVNEIQQAAFMAGVAYTLLRLSRVHIEDERGS